MSQFCAAHQPPRAGVDPVDTAAAALGRDPARHAPSRHGARRSPSSSATTIAAARSWSSTAPTTPTRSWPWSSAWPTPSPCPGRDGALVVASIRPGRGPMPGDVDRWLEASAIADDAGVDLLEWFVIDGGAGAGTAWCPRDLLGEPPRWPPRR